MVSELSKCVKSFHDRRQPFRIYHGFTNSTRKPQLTRQSLVDTSPLNNVIQVDRSRQNVLVEPNVSMDMLVDATLKHDLVPPVVMEFPAITVGGGYSGTSGESSSFRYGIFDNIVTRVEVILGNGEIVMASPSERSHLFYGLAGAYGTLGVVTLLELQLVPARRFVELTYHPFGSVAEAIHLIKLCSKDENVDYLDGILFGLNQGVIMAGCLRDIVPDGAVIQGFTRASDPWFYLDARKRLKNNKGGWKVTIPLTDYLFRYDRGAFWVGAIAFRYFLTPFNRVTRRLLDFCMHTKVMYHAMHESGLAEKYFVQDIAVPISNAERFLHYLNDALSIYPLWLCPIKQVRHGMEAPITTPAQGDGQELMLNIGIWGPGPKNTKEFELKNREVEQRTNELHGLKCLYARSYYTEEEFWKLYDQSRYSALRLNYHASTLPDLYTKMNSANPQPDSAAGVHGLCDRIWGVWPLGGIRGALKALMGSEYLILDGKKSRKDVRGTAKSFGSA